MAEKARQENETTHYSKALDAYYLKEATKQSHYALKQLKWLAGILFSAIITRTINFAKKTLKRETTTPKKKPKKKKHKFNNKIKKSDITELFLHSLALGTIALMNPANTLEVFFYGLILPDLIWVFYFTGLLSDKQISQWKGYLHKFAYAIGIISLPLLKIHIFLAVITHYLIDMNGQEVKKWQQKNKSKNGKNTARGTKYWQ